MIYYNVTIVGIVLLSFILRFYKLQDLMMFIGDQGWFYISARDLILKNDVPLVGITSSHTWLHQGALWTYMLAPVLWLFNFNPVGGAYLSSLLGVITVFLVYKVGKEIFSRNIGLIAAFLYATSPLVIVHARLAYHTSPIPLFTTMLFYAVYKWIKGNVFYFPFIIFLLAILYNLELATFTLVPIIVILLLTGFATKKEWVKGLVNKKIVLLSFIGFIVPMIPMIIYDFSHGFPQTLKFIVWVGYKIAVTLRLYPPLHPNAPGETYATMLPFVSMLITRLVFIRSDVFTWILLLASFGTLFWFTLKAVRKRQYITSFTLLFIFFTILALGYVSAKTNSEGYLPVFFPIVMIVVAVFLEKIISFRLLYIPTFVILIFIGFSNIYTLISKNYLMGKNGYGPPLYDRISIAKEIIKKAENNKYNLKGKGEGSQYESFTMNYEYLTWWLGQAPSKEKQDLVFTIEEKEGKIYLNKND